MVERGERGPQGDHGQDGERGPRGARGPANRLALIGYLILAATMVAFAVQDYRADVKIKEAVVLICAVADANRDSLRSTLLDAARRTATSKQRTAEEKAEAAKFYRDALNRIPPSPCQPSELEGSIPIP